MVPRCPLHVRSRHAAGPARACSAVSRSGRTRGDGQRPSQRQSKLHGWHSPSADLGVAAPIVCRWDRCRGAGGTALMTPATATFAFLVVTVGLFLLDRDKSVRTSRALWIPVIWLSLAGSRPISHWFGMGPGITSIEQAMDGDPFDRTVQTALIVAGIMLLFRRGPDVRVLLRANTALVVFLSYCAVSVLWSDFPLIAFKRWIKGTGDIVMILIILTDQAPKAALEKLLTRVGLLLLPASMLLIKYYPALGQSYGPTGTVRYNGVTLDKNMLGAVCLIVG